MTASVINRKIITPDDLEVRQIYNEYRQMKMLLDFIRKPETQEILQRMKGYSPKSPLRVGIKRRSRI